MLLTLVIYSRLEKIIRDLVASGSFDRIKEILDQLCNDYAYAVHQPHARNGGLIGLAAAAIALGTVCPAFFLPAPVPAVRNRMNAWFSVLPVL
jgi:vacuole morphology and inheritance protein 14